MNFAQQSEQTHFLLFDGGKKVICANKRLLIGEKAYKKKKKKNESKNQWFSWLAFSAQNEI